MVLGKQKVCDFYKQFDKASVMAYDRPGLIAIYKVYMALDGARMFHICIHICVQSPAHIHDHHQAVRSTSRMCVAPTFLLVAAENHTHQLLHTSHKQSVHDMWGLIASYMDI